METSELSKLEQKILYTFNNKEILREGLRHSSFVNEQIFTEVQDNERLEFLGDAVLNLVISHILMRHFPESKEGALSIMRASLVNESQLSVIAQSINLGEYIQLGKGELQSQGREKKSILANTYEAVIASIYLDGGFEKAFTIIERHFSKLIDSITATATPTNDYKSHLQEIAQITHKAVPQYSVCNESGPDHDKTFNVLLKLCNLKTEGIGKSKKMAEQDAAKKALEILKREFLTYEKG